MMPMPRLAKHVAFAICMAQLQGRTDFRCWPTWLGQAVAPQNPSLTAMVRKAVSAVVRSNWFEFVAGMLILLNLA